MNTIIFLFIIILKKYNNIKKKLKKKSFININIKNKILILYYSFLTFFFV